jgi:phosphatidate phosphatase APP1
MPTLRPRTLSLAAVLPLLVLALAFPASAFGGPKDTWIDFFGGWGSQNGGQIFARVHKGKAPAPPRPNENTAEKFLQTIEALELDALPNAQVTITIRGLPAPIKATTDSHGFLEVDLPKNVKGPLARVAITVPASKDYKTSTAMYPVPIWQDKAGQIGVLSDIDDTLTDSDVPHKLHLIYNTLFHTQYDVKVFDGAGKAVSDLSGTAMGFPVRPVIYLSGSPWNLHSRIEAAFHMHGLPKGAFILRRFSKEPQDAYAFKVPHVQKVLSIFPQTKWVYFGDNGEKDPEVYAEINKEKPGNTEAIYIHEVVPADHNGPRFQAGAVKMSVFKAWSEVSADTHARGLVFGQAKAVGLKPTGTQ